MSFFYRITGSIRVTIRPRFLTTESAPDHDRYVWSYRVRLENIGDERVTVVRRHWTVRDPITGTRQIDGTGPDGHVVPLEPATVYEHESYLVLGADRGVVDGHYELVLADGRLVRVPIPLTRLRVAR